MRQVATQCGDLFRQATALALKSQAFIPNLLPAHNPGATPAPARAVPCVNGRHIHPRTVAMMTICASHPTANESVRNTGMPNV